MCAFSWSLSWLVSAGVNKRGCVCVCAAGLLSLCGVHMKTPLAHKGFTHGKINRPVIELCCSGSPGERLICAPVRPLSKPQIMVRGQWPPSLSRKHTLHSSNNYRTTWVNNALNRLCSEHGETFLDKAGLKQTRPWFTLNNWNRNTVYKCFYLHV